MNHIMDGARQLVRMVKGEPYTPHHAQPEPDLGPWKDQAVEALAAKAYRAYGDRVTWRTHDGKVMPRWDWLATPQRDAWRAAVSSVLVAVRVGPGE